jgi:hypothetical protein
MNDHCRLSRRISFVAIFFSLSFSAGAAELVAQYVLDGDGLDSSANAFHGTVTDVTFVADPVRGTVASFDGVSSAVNVAASGQRLTENIDDAAGNGQFAISMWILPAALNPDGGIDINVLMGGTSGVIEIVGDGSWGNFGAPHGSIGANSGGGAGDAWLIPGIDIYDGEWHHVVIQWEDQDLQSGGTGYSIELYIDGQLGVDSTGQQYNGNGNGTDLSLGGPAVGSNGGGRNKYYTGLMSDVQFYDDQLTTEEVESIFAGGTIELPPFQITEIKLLPGDEVQLTWNSTPEATYTVFWSPDGTNFASDAGDDFPSQGESTTVVIDSSAAPIDTSARLLFRVRDNAG